MEHSTPDQLKSTFIRMYQEEYILKCTPEESITQLDKVMAEEDDAIDKRGSIMTATEIKKLKKQLAEKRESIANDAAAGMVCLLSAQHLEKKTCRGFG